MSIRIPWAKPTITERERRYVAEALDSTWISGATEFTFAATGIYFADHSLTNNSSIGTLLNHPNKFMSDGAIEAGVAASNLQVGITDP